MRPFSNLIVPVLDAPTSIFGPDKDVRQVNVLADEKASSAFGLIGDACSEDNDCVSVGSECSNDKKCACRDGYPLDKASNTCRGKENCTEISLSKETLVVDLMLEQVVHSLQ